jgi:hypothetical protein
VDLVTGTITIRQKFYRLGGSRREGEHTKLLFGPPKSDRGQRVIEIPPDLVEDLRSVMAENDRLRKEFGVEYCDLGALNRDICVSLARIQRNPSEGCRSRAPENRYPRPRTLDPEGLPRCFRPSARAPGDTRYPWSRRALGGSDTARCRARRPSSLSSNDDHRGNPVHRAGRCASNRKSQN